MTSMKITMGKWSRNWSLSRIKKEHIRRKRTPEFRAGKYVGAGDREYCNWRNKRNMSIARVVA